MVHRPLNGADDIRNATPGLKRSSWSVYSIFGCIRDAIQRGCSWCCVHVMVPSRNVSLIHRGTRTGLSLVSKVPIFRGASSTPSCSIVNNCHTPNWPIWIRSFDASARRSQTAGCLDNARTVTPHGLLASHVFDPLRCTPTIPVTSSLRFIISTSHSRLSMRLVSLQG